MGPCPVAPLGWNAPNIGHAAEPPAPPPTSTPSHAFMPAAPPATVFAIPRVQSCARALDRAARCRAGARLRGRPRTRRPTRAGATRARRPPTAPRGRAPRGARRGRARYAPNAADEGRVASRPRSSSHSTTVSVAPAPRTTSAAPPGAVVSAGARIDDAEPVRVERAEVAPVAAVDLHAVRKLERLGVRSRRDEDVRAHLVTRHRDRLRRPPEALRDGLERPRRRARPGVVAIGRDVEALDDHTIGAVAVDVEVLALGEDRPRVVAERRDRALAARRDVAIGVDAIARMIPSRASGQSSTQLGANGSPPHTRSPSGIESSVQSTPHSPQLWMSMM